MGEYAEAFAKREQRAHDQADTIKSRLTTEMGNTLTTNHAHPEYLLTALVDDAMFQIEKLLAEMHHV